MLFYQLKIFIGGLPVEDDIQVLKNGECKIAVGTVGRLISLIK
jgi:superfamily II DNA/RNA helicase